MNCDFRKKNYNSSHPKSVLKGFIEGEVLRNIRNTSRRTELKKQLEAFKTSLLKRGYKISEINEFLYQTQNIERENLLIQRPTKREQPLVMLTKFNPSIQKLKNIITKHCNLISLNPECVNIFNHQPIIAYKRHTNLQELLSKH